MKIFPTSVIKNIDADTIRLEPVSSIELMERAARAFTNELLRYYDGDNTPFAIFAGPGNNGGDALAVARLLIQKGCRVVVWLCAAIDKLSPDCAVNLERLQALQQVETLVDEKTAVTLPSDCVVIDGLFGSGLTRPLEGFYAHVVQTINSSGRDVVSIDIPSGLMGEDNACLQPQNIIRATHTITFQFPKLSMLFAENGAFVGNMTVVDISLSAAVIDSTPASWYMTEKNDIQPLLVPRERHAHKGCFGRLLLVAGSRGMAGASVLAARAAMRSGVGLLTVHVPGCNNLVMQTAVPEAMTSIDVCEECFSTVPQLSQYSAVAVGPGIGRDKKSADALKILMQQCRVPMILDADALNILAENPEWLRLLPCASVITPHPGEFARLAGGSKDSYQALQKAVELAMQYNIYIVLKGAYSVVVTPSGECHFNSTGNPGMATAGSGDVLTGILASLLAQGYTMPDAARIAVYAHGLSGDIATMNVGQRALIAGDIIEFLPDVWLSLGEQ